MISDKERILLRAVIYVLNAVVEHGDKSEGIQAIEWVRYRGLMQTVIKNILVIIQSEV